MNWFGESDVGLMFFVGFVFDTNGFWWRGFVEEDSNNFGLKEDEEVGVLAVLK